MAETADLKTTVEHTGLVANTPHKAEIIDGGVPHVRYAVAVTDANGLQVKSIDEHDLWDRPFRVKGTRQVSELDSFLHELTRRPLTDGASTLWGDYTTGTVIAVYNEHTTAEAGWRDDLLTLQLVTDPDWAAWTKISGKWFTSQVEFGDIIEELLHTVIDPDQADLLEIIHSIRAHSSAQFESRIDRSTSAQALAYTEEISASAGGTSSGTLEVPKVITLRLRPWEGHTVEYDVEAWFRLQVNSGQLALMIKLKPYQQLLRKAWTDMLVGVVEQTQIPVLAYRGNR
jgi:uncharacterized protein YfdQ (DUF2303 family)